MILRRNIHMGQTEEIKIHTCVFGCCGVQKLAESISPLTLTVRGPKPQDGSTLCPFSLLHGRLLMMSPVEF